MPLIRQLDPPSRAPVRVDASRLLVWMMATAFLGVVFGVLPSGIAVQKATILLFGLAILFAQLDVPLPRKAISLVVPYLLYIVLAICSALANSDSIIYMMAAVQPLLLGPMVYAVAVTSRIDQRGLERLRVGFLLLCIVQIAFVLLKLGVHGIDEKVLIGSMSHSAGQLGFLFPAIAVPILMFLVNPRNRWQIYALLVGMFAFGIINEKRSVVFLLPVVLFAAALANRPESGPQRKRASFWLGTALMAVAGFVLGLRAIPSLNPDAGYSGGVSPAFAINYAIEYLTMDYGGSLQGNFENAATDINIQVGRVIVVLEIVRWLSQADWITMLFGAGFGIATPSEFLGDQRDPLFQLIGTRGAISGAGLAVLETGLIGLGLFFVFFFGMLSLAWRSARQARTDTARRWFRTVMVLMAVFLYDFFFYSTTLLRTLPMPVLIFAIAASLPIARRVDMQFNSN